MQIRKKWMRIHKEWMRIRNKWMRIQIQTELWYGSGSKQKWYGSKQKQYESRSANKKNIKNTVPCGFGPCFQNWQYKSYKCTDLHCKYKNEDSYLFPLTLCYLEGWLKWRWGLWSLPEVPGRSLASSGLIGGSSSSHSSLTSLSEVSKSACSSYPGGWYVSSATLSALAPEA